MFFTLKMRYIESMGLIRIFSYFLLVIALCLPSLSNAQTQDRNRSDSQKVIYSKDKVFDLPPPNEIKRAFLVEMDSVHNECKIDIFENGHRDCKCYAMSFLEQRVKLPNVSKDIIESAIYNTCFDKGKMEAFYFGQCTAKIKVEKMIKKKKDPIEVCDCYAKSVADKISRHSRVNYKTLNWVEKDAYVGCGL